MFSLFGLVGHVMEDLVGHDRRDRSANFVVPGNVGTTLTLKKKDCISDQTKHDGSL